MAAPYYNINGVNMLPFLAEEGLLWEENDIDAPNSGRFLDGIMYRFVVARKDKHTLMFKRLTLAEVRTVTAAIGTSNYITVETNVHPKRPGIQTFQMYNSSRKGAVFTLEDDSTASWKLENLSLIER